MKTERERFDYCLGIYQNQKNSGAAYKSWQKIHIASNLKKIGLSDQQLSEKIYLAIQAQNRYRKEQEKKSGFLPPWRLFSTWLNNNGWEDIIPSHYSLREKVGSYNKLCECGKEVIGPTINECEDCYLKKYGAYENMINARIKKEGYENKSVNELKKIAGQRGYNK